MSQSTGLTRELDRIAVQSPLGKEGREICLRALREGTDAQAIRGAAILACAGEKQPLPVTLRSSGWPNLPKREAEVRALAELAQKDPGQLQSFITALLVRLGPQEK